MNNFNLDLENYDLWYKPFWHTKFFYFIVICFLFLLLCVIVFFIYKKFKKIQHKEDLKSILVELNNLEKDLPKISSKEFYFILISLIKERFKYY